MMIGRRRRGRFGLASSSRHSLRPHNHNHKHNNHSPNLNQIPNHKRTLSNLAVVAVAAHERTVLRASGPAATHAPTPSRRATAARARRSSAKWTTRSGRSVGLPRSAIGLSSRAGSLLFPRPPLRPVRAPRWMSISIGRICMRSVRLRRASIDPSPYSSHSLTHSPPTTSIHQVIQSSNHPPSSHTHTSFVWSISPSPMSPFLPASSLFFYSVFTTFHDFFLLLISCP